MVQMYHDKGMEKFFSFYWKTVKIMFLSEAVVAFPPSASLPYAVVRSLKSATVWNRPPGKPLCKLLCALELS